MPRRKFRPILLEVASRDRGGDTRPRGSTAVEGEEPDASSVPQPRRTPAWTAAPQAVTVDAELSNRPAAPDAVHETADYVPSLPEALLEFWEAARADWRPPALVGVAVALLMLGSFLLGRSFGATAPSGAPGVQKQPLAPPAASHAPAQRGAELPRPDLLPTVQPPRAAETEPQAGPGAAPADPAAIVAAPQQLTPGMHYLVVQYFTRARQEDADKAADFLTRNGVPTAVYAGSGDYMAIALEPFHIDQKDAAAARAERSRAEALIRTVRELGKKYQPLGRYDFGGCRLQQQ